MALQNSSTVLLGRYTRDGKSSEDLYEINHLILTTELFKLIASIILETYTTHNKLYQSIQNNIIQQPVDAMKVSIPSVLFVIQNTLLFVALSNLRAPVFHVTYQCKLVTTALMSVVMLGRRYSMKQWVCLFCLGLGVAIVVLGEENEEEEEDLETSIAFIQDSSEHDEIAVVGNQTIRALDSTAMSEEEQSGNNNNNNASEQSVAKGLLAVSIGCICSALAGVYFEMVIKKPTQLKDGTTRPPVSLWMRNIQLSFFSICIAFVQYVQLPSSPLSNDDSVPKKPFLYGFDKWVFLLALAHSGGGLLVAAVIKYADNVLKGIATGVSVVIGTILSTIWFDTKLTLQFTMGAVIILLSVYLFSNDVPDFIWMIRKNLDKEMVEDDEDLEGQGKQQEEHLDELAEMKPLFGKNNN